MFDIDREAAKRYWSVISDGMPNLKKQVEIEFKINRKKLGQIGEALRRAGTNGSKTDLAEQVTEHLIRSRSGSWARIHVESPTMNALQTAK